MKNVFDSAFESIKSLQYREGASIGDHIIKLQEEVGEIAESHLMMTGYKEAKRTTSEEKSHLTEEAVDAVIVCMAILASNGADKHEIDRIFAEKIGKWETAFANKQKRENV